MDLSAHQSNILYREGLNDILADTFIFPSFIQMIIKIAFTMHEHLHSLSVNISDVVGMRKKSNLFKDRLSKLQVLGKYLDSLVCQIIFMA